ncbi:MAG: hypothetical protein M1814_002595 [Vezdaea aestivalis]|nr:MAG: hypothetical protein M1814_002595 [Vezdaea aestivalis]
MLQLSRFLLLVLLHLQPGFAVDEEQSTAFQYRQKAPLKNNDMVCNGELPLRESFWPKRRGRSMFYDTSHPERSMQRLCAADSTHDGPTMGCLCLEGADGGRHVSCIDSFADRYLINAGNLRRVCIQSCECPQREQPGAKEADEDLDWEQVEDDEKESRVEGGWLLEDGKGGENRADLGASGGSGSVYHTPYDSPRGSRSSEVGALSLFDEPRHQCRGQCKNQKGCLDRQGCRCFATKYDDARMAQRSGKPWFLGFCMDFSAAVSLSLGKRSEALLCPCNSTYVSAGCCEARNGLVWEHEGLKMGELALGAL